MLNLHKMVWEISRVLLDNFTNKAQNKRIYEIFEKNGERT